MDSLTEQEINAVCSSDCRPFYDDVATNCQIEEVCMYLRMYALVNIRQNTVLYVVEKQKNWIRIWLAFFYISAYYNYIVILSVTLIRTYFILC